MTKQPEQPVERQRQPTTRGFIALDDPARFAALIAEASPNLIYVYDLIENVTLYTNRRMQTLLGYTPADLEAMGPGLLFYVLRAEDVAEVRRHFAELRSTADGEVRERSYHVRHKDGTWRWVRSHEMVIQRDAHGAVTQVLGIAEDVTARTGPEAELRWQADLLEHAQEAVIAWNLDGTITFWNLGAERMYGYRSAEATDRLHQIILRGRGQPDHATIMADLLRTGSWAGDLIRYARDGRQLVISSHMILISGLAGQRQVLETNRDFTTRKEAELALQASEERWRNLIASIDQGFCVLEMIYGPEGRPFDYCFLEVNPAFERHSGLRDAVGKTARQLVPELEHTWLDTFARVIETGEPLRFEQRSAQLGRWFEIDAVRVGEDDSRRAALLFTDITARKQADADARLLSEVSEQIRVAIDPEELLATMAQMIGRHLGFWRCSFITIDANVERWTIHRDYREAPTLPSLTGTYSLAHYPPELIAELRSGRVITIQDSASEPLTAAFYQRGFRPLGIEAALGVPLLQDGRWVAAFLAGADTPRSWTRREIALMETLVERTWNAVVQKRSEQAIRRAHERLSLALERLDGFVYEYDVRTGQTERSAGNARVLGYEPDALTQQRVWWSQQIHPDDNALTMAQRQDAHAGPAAGYSLEYRVRHRDGHYLTVWDRGQIERDLQGRPLRVLGTVINISERKQADAERIDLLIKLQQALQATESALARAEEATRERDLLISIAAHDLRTPLTVILGQALLVRQRAERAGMDERILHTLTTISTQAERLNQMIDALLDLSRIQEGRLTIQPSLCDLVALLRRVVDALQSTVSSSHQIHLEVPACTITLMGDALRLEQVFFNLLGNAVKYSPDGGQITIWVETVGPVVRIHTRDHGIGIPTDALPFLFTRFYRAPNAIPQATSSLGVGLYIVRELIHAHGGSIAVDSIEGQGSTFTVQLPLPAGRDGHL